MRNACSWTGIDGSRRAGLAGNDGEDLVVTTDAEAHNSATAKQVSRIVRRFRLSGDELTYEIDMAWSDGPY